MATARGETTTHDLGEQHGIVVFGIACGVHERESVFAGSAPQLRDPRPVRPKLLDVPATELLVPAGLMPEPLRELCARRWLLLPRVELGSLARDATRPEAVDQHTITVAGRDGLVRRFTRTSMVISCRGSRPVVLVDVPPIGDPALRTLQREMRDDRRDLVLGGETVLAGRERPCSRPVAIRDPDDRDVGTPAEELPGCELSGRDMASTLTMPVVRPQLVSRLTVLEYAWTRLSDFRHTVIGFKCRCFPVRHA